MDIYNICENIDGGKFANKDLIYWSYCSFSRRGRGGIKKGGGGGGVVLLASCDYHFENLVQHPLIIYRIKIPSSYILSADIR